MLCLQSAAVLQRRIAENGNLAAGMSAASQGRTHMIDCQGSASTLQLQPGSGVFLWQGVDQVGGKVEMEMRWLKQTSSYAPRKLTSEAGKLRCVKHE